MKWSIGDTVILAKPRLVELKGVEVEILAIVSELDRIYQIKILKDNTIFNAREEQLSELEYANKVINWEDAPVWLQKYQIV